MRPSHVLRSLIENCELCISKDAQGLRVAAKGPLAIAGLIALALIFHWPLSAPLPNDNDRYQPNLSSTALRNSLADEPLRADLNGPRITIDPAVRLETDPSGPVKGATRQKRLSHRAKSAPVPRAGGSPECVLEPAS
jgi:hypothetical protein